MCKYVQVCASLRKYVQVCTCVCKCMHEYVQVCASVYKCMQVHRYLLVGGMKLGPSSVANHAAGYSRDSLEEQRGDGKR